ncbi:MAG: ATP-binding cassette domain-containing protein, partial [Acidimicrobiales bacterium]
MTVGGTVRQQPSASSAGPIQRGDMGRELGATGTSDPGVAAPGEPKRSPGEEPALVLEHATKSFGAVHALVDGDITLQWGETHGLVGENGAGKSTLVKILAGVHQPDSGRLFVNGREVTLDGPAASRDVGIAVIHQEASVFPDLSVAENV